MPGNLRVPRSAMDRRAARAISSEFATPPDLQPCRGAAVVLRSTTAPRFPLLFGASDEATRTWCTEAAASNAAILAHRSGILARSRRSPCCLAADDHPFDRHRGAARDPIRA